MKIIKRPAPPTGPRRLLFRIPIHLYRMRLGWLFGGRMILLNHIGRISGKQRQVVIEVVERTPDGAYIVCSGFGPRSDWYRNLLKTPDVTIRTGLRTVPVTAHPLTSEEGAEYMARYAPRHPRLARRLARLMGFEVDGSESDYRAVGRQVPFVRLSPRG